MKNNNKRNKMNNFKKIGLSALAGSLAMVSAHAVEYTMTGGLMTTFTTEKGAGSAANGGKGFGSATDLGFNASGELDNGYTVSYFMSVDTDAALANTSSQMKLGMGSLGSLHLNNKSGSKANAIDDITPHAYNETWDGLSPDNISFFGASTNSGSIDYRIPAQEYMGTTVNASVTYDPNSGVGSSTKGGVGTSSVTGIAYTLQVAHESGVEFGAGVETLDDDSGLVGGGSDNTENTTGYVKYSFEGLSAAIQRSYSDARTGTSINGADKQADYMSIAYTAGDMSFSYAEAAQETKAVIQTAALATIKQSSLQAAYTMGAMTISAATSETKNVAGVAADKHQENTLAVSFAF